LSVEVEIPNTFLHWLTWNSLYASLALVGVALLLRFWKRAPASVAHLCWWLVFIRLLLPIDFGLPFSIGSLLPPVESASGEPVVLVSFPFAMADSAVGSSVPANVAPDGISWTMVLLSFWGVGALSTLVWVFHRRRRVTTLLRGARDVENPVALEALSDCSRELRVSTRVRLVHGEGLVSPFTTGILRPVIWVPTKLLEHLDPDLLRCLIAHELVHVKRRDDLFIRLELLIQSLFFFHPLVWLAGARLDRTREQACDQHVVTAFGVTPRDYGRSLLETLRLNLLVANPLASFGGGRKRSLEMRLRALSTIPKMNRIALAIPFVAAWLLLPMARSVTAAPSLPTNAPTILTASVPDLSEASSLSSGDEIMRVGDDIAPPRVIKRVEPEYPKEARKNRATGVVVLEAVIDESGRVESVKALEDLPFGLTEAALDAVRQWEFEPATLGGKPVKVFFNLTVKFKLAPGVKLTHPLPAGRVTSGFGDEQAREGETMKVHSGTDLAAPKGTPVLAAADGEVVTATAYDPDRVSAGTFVIIDHGSATKTFYSHLDTIAVAPGQRVRAGDTIGTVGNTGVSSGPHLHFEVWSADHPVDPMRLIK